jgi:hypothetical protein
LPWVDVADDAGLESAATWRPPFSLYAPAAYAATETLSFALVWSTVLEVVVPASPCEKPHTPVSDRVGSSTYWLDADAYAFVGTMTTAIPPYWKISVINVTIFVTEL